MLTWIIQGRSNQFFVRRIQGHCSYHCVDMSRVGRWKDAVTANIRAFNADMALSKKCMVAYGPEHNTDMLIYAANMAGLVSC